MRMFESVASRWGHTAFFVIPEAELTSMLLEVLTGVGWSR